MVRDVENRKVNNTNVTMFTFLFSTSLTIMTKTFIFGELGGAAKQRSKFNVSGGCYDRIAVTASLRHPRLFLGF